MVKLSRIHYFFWPLLLLGLCSQCQNLRSQAEHTYRTHCGSCHTVPDPADLPKYLWAERVLPEMATRLGVRIKGYDPLEKMSWEEKLLISRQHFYPQQGLISPGEWKALYEFVIEQAPVALPQPPPLELDKDGAPFRAKAVSLDQKKGAFTTFISYHDSLQRLLIGNGFGELLTWTEKSGTGRLEQTDTPVLSYEKNGGREFVLEVGEMRPTELRSGSFYRLENGEKQRIRDSLHRPVYTLVEDMNQDGRLEIFLCEYGNYSGGLSLLTAQGDGTYRYDKVLDMPGIMRVIAEDMDRDGRKDLVLMAAQGDEGVDILYQQDNLQFSRERVLRFSPVYGSSWFELIDYDGDGDRDIITVNGDNADFSYTLKPYHGLRIFLNDGQNQFSEALFYPIPGATRVVARDFDQDGDVDMAVTSFFPDFERQPEAAFVYLENVQPEAFRFNARTFPGSADGRWLIMEAEDYDRDGDEDLILGSMTLSLMPIPEKIKRRWQLGNTDIVILENQTLGGFSGQAPDLPH